jgi:hypothetical protein
MWMPNDNIVGRAWEDYKISIKQLEDLLNAPGTIRHYDFLNNDWIDGSVKAQLKDLNKNSSVNAPLPGFQAYLSAVSDGAVWHTGVIEDGSIENSSINMSPVEVGVTQVGSTEVGSLQHGSIQVRAMQDGIAQIRVHERSSIEAGIPQNSPFEVRTRRGSERKSGFSQIGSAEVGVIQIGSKEISTPDYRIAEVSSFQNRLRSINIGQVGISEAGINQVGSSNLRTMQVDPAQIRSAEMNHRNNLAIFPNLSWKDVHTEEVPLSERVTVQQFLNFDSLSSHAHAVTVDRIGASVPSLWGKFLSTNTPFDLQLAVDVIRCYLRANHLEGWRCIFTAMGVTEHSGWGASSINEQLSEQL